jgi:non-specific serine/threonine protein kinase/serine/threonine-protein kinase
MDDERWNDAKSLFAAALECEPARREAFLRDACGQNEWLRLEVESLLSAYRTSDRLSTPAWIDDRVFSANVEGGTLGTYRLVRKIGEGGMGQVWLAEQTAPVRRHVALKLVRVGIFDEAVLRRFRAECQSLAMMDHPTIAKVLDAGATPDGQPFLVMDYVPGEPITDYCNRRKLKIRERLELFVAACEGVQHAHQKAIIHRDLKPANLLVVDVDGRPTPRIIDFGLAKAITPQPDELGMVTRIGSFIGTPGYISPEQADPARDVDTRADVYSLGVVLYELLAGVLPFAEQRNQPIDELLRQLREDDPARPSTRIGAAPSTTAEQRGTEPGPLVRQLRGDLDSITMKALERDRARRYGSPSELADDIRRYLLKEPIAARPASGSYRLLKYVERHRIGVSAVVVIAILLIGSAVVQAVQLQRITRERDRANRVADFMSSMFRVADPSEARGNSVTAREILDKAAKDIQTGLARDPYLQAQMMDLIGNVYTSLGLYASAQAVLEQAGQAWTRTVGADSPLLLTSQHNLAEALGRRGRYPESEQLERRTWEASKRILGPDHPDTLRSMASLAITVENEGRLKEAEQLNRDAIALARPALGDDHAETLRPMNSLGNVLQREAHYVDAEKYHADVLERRRRVLGPDHAQTIVTMQGLAGDYRGEGRLVDAERVDRETLEIRRRIFGPAHQYTLQSMLSVARDVARQGKPAEAELINREALDIARSALGPEHPDTASLMINLALNVHAQKRYVESEQLNRAAIEIDRRVLGPEHSYTLAAMGNLARDLGMEGKLHEAELLARETVALEAHSLGPEHPSTLDAMQTLRDCLKEERLYAESESLSRQLLLVMQRIYGADDFKTADAAYELATTLALAGKQDEAITTLADAVAHGLRRERIASIQTDANFTSLRGRAGFKALVAAAAQRAGDSR